MSSPINFFNADTNYNLKSKNKIKLWVISEIERHNFSIDEINIILCSDKYLLKINTDFLNHSDLTDVITFDNSIGSSVGGEIYISVDRIRENAKIFKVKVFNEFIRIIIHGVLHLLKFSDKSPVEKDIMTEKENQAILNFYK